MVKEWLQDDPYAPSPTRAKAPSERTTLPVAVDFGHSTADNFKSDVQLLTLYTDNRNHV